MGFRKRGACVQAAGESFTPRKASKSGRCAAEGPGRERERVTWKVSVPSAFHTRPGPPGNLGSRGGGVGSSCGREVQ